MTKEQAYRQATKRWGKNAMVRQGPRMSSPEMRKEATDRMLAARAEKEAIDQEIKERLAALDWYQDLLRRRRAAQKAHDDARSKALYKRFDVGTTDSMFFHVRGSGDTFKEAFAEADARR